MFTSKADLNKMTTLSLKKRRNNMDFIERKIIKPDCGGVIIMKSREFERMTEITYWGYSELDFFVGCSNDFNLIIKRIEFFHKVP